MEVELLKGVKLKYASGELSVSVGIAAIANPVLNDLREKVDSGAIDPVKGTELDKAAMLQAIDFLISEVNK